MKELNINTLVQVRLTQKGVTLLIEDTKRNGAVFSRPTIGDAVGTWTEFSLWELMQIFGPHISMGQYGESLPFAPTMRVVYEPDLTPCITFGTIERKQS